jgi:hypothetical protein
MTKNKDLKLTAELVPSTVWESSLYKLIPRETWNSIRNDFIKENARKCQVCGETEGRMNLHEIWEYDDAKHIQKLEGFILLCEMCHHVKHLGLAGILANEGKLDYDKVIEHFCTVNSCTKKEFEYHIAKAFEVWKKRSQEKWTQDFGKYKGFVRNEKRI